MSKLHRWGNSHTGDARRVAVLWVDPALGDGHFTLPFVQHDAELKARLAYAIRAAREQAGLSRPELAERVGVNRGAVYTWEKGSSVPSMLNLGALADALGVSADLFAHPPPVPESPVARWRLPGANGSVADPVTDALPIDRPVGAGRK